MKITNTPLPIALILLLSGCSIAPTMIGYEQVGQELQIDMWGNMMSAHADWGEAASAQCNKMKPGSRAYQVASKQALVPSATGGLPMAERVIRYACR